MSKVLDQVFLKQLKTILQSNLFYIILIILVLFYVFINVIIIKHESIYQNNNKVFYGTIIKISPSTITIKGKEKLICNYKNNNYKLGDYVKLEGVLNTPSNNTILNNFNYKEYLKYNNIYYILDVKNISLIKENNNVIYKIRNYLNEYLSTYKSKSYLQMFLLKDYSYIDNNIYESYQINGISHLLSVGSIHIILFISFYFKLLKKIKVNYFISNLLLFIILFLFIMITDYSISYIRILIYLIFKFLNKLFKLNLKSIKLFIFTISLTLLINPYFIFYKGFLYSYGISFIIILNKNNIVGNYFIRLIKVSVISFIYSIPFNIYFNYSINLFSIVYSIIFIPLFNIIIVPLSIITFLIPKLDILFFNIINFINNISLSLNNVTIGIIILKKINIIILIIYLIIFTYIILGIFNDSKKRIIILIIILFIHYNINYIISNNFYMVIDVSQGDSSLYSNNNKNILIDTGGIYNKNISKNTIIMLKSLGIRKLDYLVLTHGDYDHMGEAINLINNFKVEKVIFNCGPYNELEQEFIKVLDKKKIKYYSCIKELNIDKNKLSFLQTKEYDNENDNSNVIYTELDGYKFMFMGDASVTTEKEILNNYNLPDIDVLKVGHHGSRTSSSKEFIYEISPKYSVISVGKNNRYGHPNKEVLDNLDNSKIYRTDENGSIMFKIKNNKLQVETCSP